MTPDPDSLLAWVHRLARAGVVRLTPRVVRDVEALLTRGVARDLDELGVCLTALLAHDQASARSIQQLFGEWKAVLERPPPARYEVWLEPVRQWAHRLSAGRWAAMLSVIALVGIGLPVLLLKLVEHCPSTSPTKEPEENRPEPKPANGTETIVSPIEAGRAYASAPDQRRTELSAAPMPEPWIVAILGVGSLLLAGLAARWWSSVEDHRRDLLAARERAEGERDRAQRAATRLAVPYHIEVSPPLSLEAVEAAATVLARLAADHPGRELDVERTIARTIDAGGFVQPMFEPVRQHATLLVLVDVEQDGHPDLHRVNRLLELWKRGGLVFTRYDFAFRPNVLNASPNGTQVELGTLAKRHEGAPLLIISRFARPANKNRNLVWPERLSDWPARVWLDLDPRVLDERTRDARTRRRAIEATGLRRFPFTAEGLLACARTLAARGEHAAPLDEQPLRPLSEVGPWLELWAACACLVPDPIWAQLDALRRAIPPLTAALPDPRYVHRLIEWLHQQAREQKWGDTSHLGYGDRLEVLPQQLHALREALRRYDRTIGDPEQRLELRAWKVLETQLLAADVSGDPLGAQLRDLKLDVIRALLDPERARELNGRWQDKAVAVELGEMLAPEQRLETKGLGLNGGWGRSFWEPYEHATSGRPGASVDDLVRPRPWTWRRVRTLASALVVVAVGYGVWWSRWPKEVAVSVLVRGKTEVIPPRWEVLQRELVECEDEVALKDLAPLQMRCVAGGRFLMGSLPGEIGREKDEEQHIAEVGALMVGETEVTQGQWKAVMGTEPFNCEYGCGDEYPAQSVSWNDAVRFMNELTKLENARRTTEEQLSLCYEETAGGWAWTNRTCTGYRLPTEAEWEHMARAGTTSAYSFGADAKELCKYGNGGDQALRRGRSEAVEAFAKAGVPFLDCDDGAVDLANVRSYEANQWGLYDVHGNVWEWAWDWYDEKYSYESTAEMYAGPESGEYRVLRGGSFMDFPQLLRSALRSRVRPTHADWSSGFRCVRGFLLPEPPSAP